MENLNELKLLHEKVQADIFRILVKYQILSCQSYTIKSQTPLYFFSEEYKFMFAETSVQTRVFLESIDRLLETGFLNILSDKKNPESIYFIIKTDIENLLKDEKDCYCMLHDKTISKLLSSHTASASGMKLCNNLL